MRVPSVGVVSRAASLLLSAVAAGVLVWLLNSPLFLVRDVTVHRAESSPPPVVDPARIEAVAETALAQNVFRVDTDGIEAELRAIPGVADALVAAGIDGRVTVTISYRAPVANWVVLGQSYLVDGDGEILSARYLPDLQLTVEDRSRAAMAPGDRINLDALHAAYQLQNNLPLLRVMPSQIQYSGGGLLVVDHSGLELQFGGTDRMESKLVALHAVLEQASRLGERIASVDLRPVDRPTYRTVDAPPVISTLGAPP